MGGGIVNCIYADDNQGLHDHLCTNYYVTYTNDDGEAYNECDDLARIVALEIAAGVS